MRRLVRAVIQNATVTQSDDALPVAARIDPILLRAAALLPLEELEIINTRTGERFSTWAEAGGEGTGEVRIHSGVGHHVRTGDVITIVAFALLHDGQTLNHRAKIIAVDGGNRLVSLLEQ